MIIKPSIRNNFFTNAHPEGCKQIMQQVVFQTNLYETVNNSV